MLFGLAIEASKFTAVACCCGTGFPKFGTEDAKDILRQQRELALDDGEEDLGGAANGRCIICATVLIAVEQH